MSVAITVIQRIIEKGGRVVMRVKVEVGGQTRPCLSQLERFKQEIG